MIADYNNKDGRMRISAPFFCVVRLAGAMSALNRTVNAEFYC